MTYDPNSEEGYRRLMALVEEMEGQTDRGVAIVGAAWVEEGLFAAIESFLHSGTQPWKRLFDISGPMSTLSAKTDLARLLGMISKVIWSDLHIIRDIRNEFAHTPQAIDFETDEISKEVENLKVPTPHSIRP